jgi:hypothetical protein
MERKASKGARDMGLRIGRNTLKVMVLEGAATEIRHDSETTYSQQYSTLANGSFTTSALRQQTSFWLKHGDGQESQVRFGAAIPMREGHRIKAIYLGLEHDTMLSPVVVYNENTRELFRRSTPDIVGLVPKVAAQSFGAGSGALATLGLFIGPFLGAMAYGTGTAAGAGFLLGATPLFLMIRSNKRGYTRAVQGLEQGLLAAICSATGFAGSVPPDVTVRIV